MGLLLIVVVIAAVYFLAKPQGHRFHQFQNDEAEETLKKRFVSGEIDEETYLRMLKTLRN